MNQTPKLLLGKTGVGIQGANRFLAPRLPVNYRMSFKERLQSSRATAHDRDIFPDTFHVPFSKNSSALFEVVKFEKYGNTAQTVTEEFEKVGLVPANFCELLAFISEFEALPFLRRKPLIALGSSDKLSTYLAELSKPWWVRMRQKIKGFRPPNVSYPFVECTEVGNLLRKAQGGGLGWKDHCLFLGVHAYNSKYERLYGMPMTRGEYMELPVGPDVPLEIGSRFRADDGSVCEVVRFEDLPELGNPRLLSTTENGLKYYRPVFTD